MNKIQALYTSYQDIIDKIGEDRIEERLVSIKKVYRDFLLIQEFTDGKDFILNERVLLHLILDYFTDIVRLKEFHKIEKVNEDKIIAYECSWLLKRKPIQILRDTDESYVWINEKFVLYIFANHLLNNQVDSLEESNALRPLFDTLYYYLKYRNCNAKVLEMFIIMFKSGNAIKRIDYNKKVFGEAVVK